jgi:hypothetical protein
MMLVVPTALLLGVVNIDGLIRQARLADYTAGGVNTWHAIVLLSSPRMRPMRFAFFACLALAAAAPAMAQAPAIDARTAVYELRTYYPAPGKLTALNSRFREHTLKLFAKHGMSNVAYWNEIPTTEAPEGRLVYVLAYPSRAARDADWKAFGADPEWRAVVAASEAGGKLVTKVDSVFMTATDYSPPLVLPR